MFRKKKLFSRLLILMGLIIVLGACGTSENSPNENNNSNNESTNNNNNDTETSDGKISGDLEIQYFVGGYGDSWWKEVFADFEKEYPDVNIIEHSGPNINDQMRSRWVSDNPPDVVYIDGAGSSETQMVEDEQLMDLTEWIKDIEMEDGEKLIDSFLVSPNRHDDKIYTLPLIFDTWGVWYDESWFENEDFTIPEDFDSFMESMSEIKSQEDIEPFVTSGQHPHYFLRGMLIPAFGAAGGDELLADIVKGSEGVWEREEVIGVMEKVGKMQEEGMFDSGLGALNHTQSQMNFLLHDNAFVTVGLWLPNEMEEDTPDDFKYGFIPSPMQDKGEPFAVVPDLRPLAIAEKAENPEAAKAFVEFVFTREYAKLFSEHTGAMMNITDVDLSENDNVPDYLIKANEMINDPNVVRIYERPFPMSSELEEPLSNALLSLMLGNISVAEFLEEAVEESAKYRGD